MIYHQGARHRLLTPVYHMLDLTPQGRDDWYAKLAYADGPHWPPR